MSKYSSLLSQHSEVDTSVDSSSSVFSRNNLSTPKRSFSGQGRYEDDSDILSSLMTRLTPQSQKSNITSASTTIGNAMKSLDTSALSCSSSVSTKWEEMNNLAKEIQGKVKKNTNERSKKSSQYDDLSSRDSSFLPSSSKMLSNNISGKINMDDTLDSTASALKQYLEKYNPKPRSKKIETNLDDSLSDLYGKLSEFSNSYSRAPREIDSSISSVAPLRSNQIGALDHDLLSTRSNLTTNSEELFTKLENYGVKYLDPNAGRLGKKKADICISSEDSDKENHEPRMRSKSTRKSTTPKRPQSLKVSSMKDVEKTRTKQGSTSRPKTAVKSSTKQEPIEKKRDEHKKHYEPKKPLTSSKTKANQAIESISKKLSYREPTWSSLAKHSHKPVRPISVSKKVSNRLIDSENDEDSDKQDCKSCQTSMMNPTEPQQTPTMTTLASINSAQMSPGLSNSANEIAFKIVGSTDNIEKVEVYLKNSTRQSFSVNSSTHQSQNLNDSILNETNIIESFCSPQPQFQDITRSSINCDPDHSSQSSNSSNGTNSQEDTLQPLKSFYSKYFVK